MAKNITNYINFNGKDIATSSGEGLISTLTADINIEVKPFKSDNEKAPTHQIFGRSPSGHLLQIGGIWKKVSQEGNDYFTLTVRDLKFNANLGRFPGQDDESLQAIIPWGPKQD